MAVTITNCQIWHFTISGFHYFSFSLLLSRWYVSYFDRIFKFPIIGPNFKQIFQILWLHGDITSWWTGLLQYFLRIRCIFRVNRITKLSRYQNTADSQTGSFDGSESVNKLIVICPVWTPSCNVPFVSSVRTTKLWNEFPVPCYLIQTKSADRNTTSKT